MAGWMTRFHGTRRRRYHVLSLKRAMFRASNRPERLIYELACCLAGTGSFMVITWNIDEVSVRWQEFGSRSEALALYQELGSDG